MAGGKKTKESGARRRREKPTRLKVREECDRLSVLLGGRHKIALEGLRERFRDGGRLLANYLAEWRKLRDTDVAPDVQEMIAAAVEKGIAIGIEKGIAAVRGTGPSSLDEEREEASAPRRRGKRAIKKPIPRSKNRFVQRFARKGIRPAASTAAITTASGKVVIAARHGGLTKLAEKERAEREGRVIRSARPAEEGAVRVSPYLSAEALSKMDAIERFEAALAGRVDLDPRVKVRKRDWSGARFRPHARALAGHLRDLNRELDDKEVMAFFVKRFRFKGSKPHGPLEGSRIVKRGATWWFEGEPRPGRKPPKRKDVLKRFYLAAALLMLERSGKWTFPADIEDALAARHAFRRGWLAEALNRIVRRLKEREQQAGQGKRVERRENEQAGLKEPGLQVAERSLVEKGLRLSNAKGGRYRVLKAARPSS